MVRLLVPKMLHERPIWGTYKKQQPKIRRSLSVDTFNNRNCMAAIRRRERLTNFIKNMEIETSVQQIEIAIKKLKRMNDILGYFSFKVRKMLYIKAMSQ